MKKEKIKSLSERFKSLLTVVEGVERQCVHILQIVYDE